MPIVIEIVIFFLTVILIFNIVSREVLFEFWLFIIVIVMVTIGEALNLFVYKATVYTGRTGVPVYIIFGGAVIGWLYYKLPCIIVGKFKQHNFLIKIFIFLLFSIFFPVIEICGIKLGLWHWLKPYSLKSIWWWFGVWKFYFFFLAIPPLIGILIKREKT